MKNFFEINRTLVVKKRVIMIIMAVALYALPAVAQQQEWKSTSSMQGTGSYVAPVTAVGATSVGDMATTTSSAKAPGGPRRGFYTPGESGQSEGSPIGDAVLPLMLFAGAFLCMRVFLRRKRALSR